MHRKQSLHKNSRPPTICLFQEKSDAYELRQYHSMKCSEADLVHNFINFRVSE